MFSQIQSPATQTAEETISVAKVLIDEHSHGFESQLFDYLISPEIPVSVGDLVSLPFGNKLCRGFVLETRQAKQSEFGFALKKIACVLDAGLFSASYLKLISQISHFYLSDFLTTLKGVLPLGLLSSFQERFHLTANRWADQKLSPTEIKILELLSDSAENNLSLKFIRQKIQSTSLKKYLDRLQEKKLIAKTVRLKKSVRLKNASPLKSNYGTGKVLNPEQAEAFRSIDEAMREKRFQKFLLHGVTGSGKTEVYFEAARRVVEAGDSVIYLVPEISLSVQLLERVKQNFPSDILTLWHSNLSDSKRLQAWKECMMGGPRLVVGARSAIFAPLDNLGLIIIDEEHDSSYKSGTRPFYDARTIAEERAKLSKAVLVSGSATPSVCSYKVAQEEGGLLTLNKRFAGQALPEVQIVDMRRELNDGNKSIFSRKLKRALDECIAKKEQAILLLNRRGHSSYVFCRDCGYAAFCDSCSVPLVYHSNHHLLRCHHCNDAKPMLRQCPSCESPRIKHTGLGTQKLEAEVIKIFPEAEVLRLDRDVSSLRNGVQEVWEQLTESADPNKSQILVGTQLVAKGLDLPRVSLVGVVHAEGGMYSPDYISTERTFQLLTQAAGRAGRHQTSGTVIFQSYIPEQEIILQAAKQDYAAFYRSEIIARRENNYPPFRKMSRILLLHEEPTTAQKDATLLAEIIKAELPEFTVLGPAPCPIEKLHKLYRWHILLKFDDFTSLQELTRKLPRLKSRFNLDIMPVSLL